MVIRGLNDLSPLVFFQNTQIRLISSHTFFFSIFLLDVKNENIWNCGGGDNGDGGGGIGGIGVQHFSKCCFQFF